MYTHVCNTWYSIVSVKDILNRVYESKILNIFMHSDKPHNFSEIDHEIISTVIFSSFCSGPMSQYLFILGSILSAENVARTSCKVEE